MADDKKPARSKEQIQADLLAARARLSANVETLIGEVHPTAVKDRTVNEAKAFVSAEARNAKKQVKDEHGWRIDRLIVLGGAVVGLLTFVGTIRAIIGKGRKRRARRALLDD